VSEENDYGLGPGEWIGTLSIKLAERRQRIGKVVIPSCMAARLRLLK
jgi:hypothetical protein